MSEKKQLGQVLGKLSEAEDILQAIIAERQDYFETRSDRWQEGEAGDAHADRTSELEDAHGALMDAIDALEGVSR